MLIGGWQLYQAGPGDSAGLLWGLIGAGALLWLAGSLFLAWLHHVHWLLGVLAGLLPAAGLLIIFVARKPLSRQEAWQQAAQKDGTMPRRGQIRPMKPLY